MKKLILWALVSVLCLSLVACGEAAPTEAPTTQPTEAPTEVPTEAPTETTVETEPFNWDAIHSLNTGVGCGGGDNTVDE